MFEKIKLGETYGYRDFITDEEKETLLNWIFDNKKLFHDQMDLNVLVLDNVQNFPKEVLNEIRKRISDVEELKVYKKPRKSIDFASIYERGSECGPHLDPTDDSDFFHIRYNICLSKPERGGETFHGKDFFSVEEKVLWKCLAQQVRHGCDRILSDKPRVIISMGFLVDKNEYLINHTSP
jgi:hypothetical protein